MKRTGSQAIWEALVGEGVETVFGYPGGAIMPAYDALPGYAIRHVLVRHEQGAAHMADGYARASGKVGVTLPITKHNYLVTRAEEIYPTLREAFHLARAGRPGPLLADITTDAQQA